ncbi:HpsJ family protein [Pelatocladus sp. BLCC-F211]|uniref:hormogonium polysaccharide biosynthesis protein HpsJ n=1 Tax=Pelatocladus sp. BLCC-F211 TaxID=3342752 RepID=UPI0035B8A506
MNNNFAAVTAARTLKVVGIILLLSFLLDFVILLFPFQPTNRLWQIDLATNLVDRGIVPLVGLAMLFAGYWAEITEDGRPSGIDLRFPALVLASLLGLIFLVIFPLHLNNVRQASVQQVDQINKQADQAENQLQSQLSQVQAQLNNEQVKTELDKQKAQVKAQLTEILKDEQKYKQALESPNVPPPVKEVLQKAKQNPQELDKFIAQQSDPQQVATQRLNQIRQSKEDAEKQAKERAWKSGMRIGMSSLLLSIGYIIIGWTGLRGMLSAQSNGVRKATAR